METPNMASNDAVAHAWANQTGRNRRSSNGNVYYEGDTIYSYGSHFPVARWVDAPNGERVVFLTTQTYSVTTSQHVSRAARSIPYGTKVFRVADVRSNYHAGHAATMLQRLDEDVAKARRARTNGPWLFGRAEEALATLRDFVRVFGVQGFEAFGWTLDDVAKGAAAEREASAERARQAQAAREQEAKRRFREEVWPAVKTWLRGGDVMRWHTPRPLPRVKGDTVETSWGASVPLEAALRAYRLAVQCRRAHKAYVPSGLAGVQLGDFALREIKANGDLVVGCHDIPFWFMRYAACRLERTA